MLKLFERERLDLEGLSPEQTAIEVRDLNLRFGQKHVLHDINMRIPKHRITALIGQSGCGKSTLIACFNRMNDLILNSQTSGEIVIEGRNINHKKENLSLLRSQVGMVFQRPNPFPMSIYDNVCYGLRLQGIKQRRQLGRNKWRLLVHRQFLRCRDDGAKVVRQCLDKRRFPGRWLNCDIKGIGKPVLQSGPFD